MKKWACAVCMRRFGSERAAADHRRDVHKSSGSATAVPRPPDEPDDESFADRAVRAELDRAMGVYNPDQEWLLP